MSIQENLARLKKRIIQACEPVNRDPAEITLVAVTKTVSADRIQKAINHGIKTIGENRIQEARKKHRIIGDTAEWHMVGHLQTNKVKDALKIFTLIHSLDSVRLARAINKRTSKPVDCLIEVNTSAEETKYGIAPEKLTQFYDSIKDLENIVIKGLMTIGPGWAIENPEVSRSCFQQLCSLQTRLQEHTGCTLPILSMGMTSDFEIAIEEGSTMIRIGTALFGPRS